MARILIIDDDATFRGMVHRVLEQAGHQVLEVGGGDDGLRSFREGGADLVICDIIMPGKDGIETIQLLREERPEVRILAVSGGGPMDPSELVSDAELLGADGSLVKPFKMSELLETVAGLLGLA